MRVNTRPGRLFVRSFALATAAMLTAAICLFDATASVAAPPTSTEGSQPDASPAELAQALKESRPLHARKEAMFAIHTKAMETGDWTEFNRLANQLNRDVTGGKASAISPPPAGAAATQFKNLSYVQYPQLEWNWCGPASGQAIVRMWSLNIAPKAVPSQDTMHSAMGTGPGGANQPGTSITGYRNGINWFLSAVYYGITTNLSQYGSTWFWNAVTQNIDANWSAGVNTTESGTTTYNGHFGGNAPAASGHYISAYGYANVFGPYLYFVDSAANATPSLGWSSQPTFVFETNAFFASFMNLNNTNRGLVW